MPSPFAYAVRTPGQTCKHTPNCGCSVAGCCFDCPKPECVYVEEQYNGMRALAASRRKDAKRLLAEGKTFNEIAKILEVTPRTVRIYYREGRNSNGRKSD